MGTNNGLGAFAIAINVDEIMQKLIERFNANAAAHINDRFEREQVLGHIVRYPGSLIGMMDFLDKRHDAEGKTEIVRAICALMKDGAKTAASGIIFQQFTSGNDYTAIGQRSFELAYKLALEQMDNIEAKNAIVAAMGKTR